MFTKIMRQTLVQTCCYNLYVYIMASRNVMSVGIDMQWFKISIELALGLSDMYVYDLYL